MVSGLPLLFSSVRYLEVLLCGLCLVSFVGRISFCFVTLVLVGLKPLSVFGLAHTLTGYTLQKYKDRYSEINPKTLGAGQDLTALIVNHLIDIDPLAKEGSETTEEIALLVK